MTDALFSCSVTINHWPSLKVRPAAAKQSYGAVEKFVSTSAWVTDWQMAALLLQRAGKWRESTVESADHSETKISLSYT